jgi:hypothetical protein
MFITNDNVEQYAAANYNHRCIDEDEFLEDFGRIKYIRRLINKFKSTGELKERLVVNHLIVLYNVFDYGPLTKILFYKFEGLHDYLKPFLLFLQRLPDRIDNYTEQTPTLYTSNIPSNNIIVHELRKSLRND